MNRFAKVVSYIFIPQVNLLLSFFLLSYQLYGISPDLTFTMIIASIFGFILPIVVFLFFRMKNKIGDNEASEKNERTLPYIIGITITAAALITSIFLKFYPSILALWITYLALLLFLTIINLFWKISAHAMGAAIFQAVLVFLYGWEALIYFSILLIISWSRIHLKLHSFWQVLFGILIGYSVTSVLLNNSLRWF